MGCKREGSAGFLSGRPSENRPPWNRELGMESLLEGDLRDGRGDLSEGLLVSLPVGEYVEAAGVGAGD